MTTYATTYGWRSLGVRRGLMTSPPNQNPVNGGRKGLTGVYGIADSITTNREGRRFESCRAPSKSLLLREFLFRWPYRERDEHALYHSSSHNGNCPPCSAVRATALSPCPNT